MNTNTLAYPDPNGQFILDTDASGVGLYCLRFRMVGRGSLGIIAGL